MENDFDIRKASQRFIEIRVSGKKTQELLAEELGINTQTVKNYEKAGSPNTQNSHGDSRTNAIAGMKIETLYKMAKFFNVSADYLLGLSDVKTPDPDVKAAAKLTGLSVDSIKHLANDQMWQWPEPASRIIDILLYDRRYWNLNNTEKRSYRSIIELLYFFFYFSDKGTRRVIDKNGNVIDISTDTTGIPGGTVKFDDYLIQNAVLVEIQQALINFKRNHFTEPTPENETK